MTNEAPVAGLSSEQLRKKYQTFEACNALNKRAMQHFESEYGPFSTKQRFHFLMIYGRYRSELPPFRNMYRALKEARLVPADATWPEELS